MPGNEILVDSCCKPVNVCDVSNDVAILQGRRTRSLMESYRTNYYVGVVYRTNCYAAHGSKSFNFIFMS